MLIGKRYTVHSIFKDACSGIYLLVDGYHFKSTVDLLVESVFTGI